MKVVISSGHGKYVAGAKGYIDEVTEARKVVDHVANLLQWAGCTVYKYHDDFTKNKRDNVNGIVRYHNSKNRGLDVSVHFNAKEKTDKPRGVEVLYRSEFGKKYAEKVSTAISKESGLKNRGAKKRTDLGFLNYTNKPAILIEVCFVDSKADVEIYKEKFDKICIAIAEAISGKELTVEVLDKKDEKKESKPKVEEKKTTGIIATIQKQLNAKYGLNIAVDNIFGSQTKKALIKGLQTELNLQFNARLVVDGIFGLKTKSACVNVRHGARGNITWLIQAMLYCRGFDPKGLDGIFGNGTENAVKVFQGKNGLTQDGIVGKNTFEKLFT